MVIKKSLLLCTPDATGYQTLIHDIALRFDGELRVCRQFESPWELLAEEKFDLVLLDLATGRNDETFLQSLHASYPDLPVLAITAPDQTELRSRCLHIGVGDYLVTPLRCEELVARIETIFHHRSVADGEHYLRWAGICLDETSNWISNGTQWVFISPAECKAMATLFKHRGRPVSKAYLCEVLGRKMPLSRNAVEALICRLRNKIRPLRLQICTLRGTGYAIALSIH